MNIVDIIIILGYIVGLLIFGYFIGSSNKSQEDYFLAKRKLPWFAVGLSVMATMLSANSFIAGPGWAYSSGLGPFVVNMAVPLSILFVLYTMVPVYYNLKITSVYEYIETRFGVKTRLLSVLGFIINSVIQVGSFVFIPSLIIQILTGWNIIYIVIGTVLVSILYTILGGIKAVIWTDVLQMAMMWIGLLAIIFIILSKSNMGFFETLSEAKQFGKLSSFSFDFTWKSTYTIWVGLLGGFVMWTRYFGFDQGQVQRILTSSSMKDVKESYVLSSIAMNIVYFLCLIVGVLLFVFYDGKEFANSNEIMISFIQDYVPVGLFGLIVASVFAAAMSSIDSLLNSLTTVFVKDIYEPYIIKTTSETSLKKVIAISSVWGIVIILFTIMGYVGTTKSVLDTVGSYISYISGPMFGVIILGMFTKKSNDSGAFYGALLGSIIVYLFSKSVGASWLWNPFIGGLSTIFFGYILSTTLFNKERSNEDFTVFSIRDTLIKNEQIYEGSVSVIPFKMDKYGYTILAFFIAQMIFLAMIMI